MSKKPLLEKSAEVFFAKIFKKIPHFVSFFLKHYIYEIYVF